MALWVGARIASREGLSSIPVRFVEDAVAGGKREVRHKTISKLSADQRALYEVLAREDGLIQKKPHVRQEKTHDDIVTLRYLREIHSQS